VTATRQNSILRHLLHAPVHLYQWRFGWLLGKRFLLLTHVGRRSGVRYQTVLEVMEYREHEPEGSPEIVVMSGFGRTANWLRSIEALPEAEVTVGSLRFSAAYRALDTEDAVNVVRRYEERNRLIAPVVRFVLSRLLGWKYSGSESEHRRLVDQLPLIAFWPRS